MKLLIASDVHGSAYWAERIAEKFNATGADSLVLLGDIYNHGPRNPLPRDYAPMRAAETFNSLADRIVAVRGNCDSEVDEMISAFPFVQACIVPIGAKRLFCTHGHVYNKSNLPRLAKGDVLIYGHFHINEYDRVQGVHCVNLGSVALPKDNSSYCLVTDSSLVVRDFDDACLFSVDIAG